MKSINKLYPVLVVILLTSCKSDIKTELVENKYENGNIKEIGAKIDNKKEGYWITYNEQGGKSTESIYVNGKVNGKVRLYFDNGVLMAKGYIKDNKEYGEWKNYYDNGNLDSHGRFKNGKKIGEWEYFTEDGQLDRKINYLSDGKQDTLIDNRLTPPLPKMP